MKIPIPYHPNKYRIVNHAYYCIIVYEGDRNIKRNCLEVLYKLFKMLCTWEIKIYANVNNNMNNNIKNMHLNIAIII